MSAINKRKWTFNPFLATKDDEDSLHEEFMKFKKNSGIEIVYNSILITKFWSPLLKASFGLAQMEINKLLQLRQGFLLV